MIFDGPSKPVAFDGHGGRVIANHLGINVIDCYYCGYAHQYPLPNQDELDIYYNTNQFYNQHSPNNWFATNRYEHENGMWQAMYDWQIKLLTRRYKNDKYKFAPYLLDIGAGDGYFMLRWNHTTGYAHGIEPSSEARQMAHYFAKQNIYNNYKELPRKKYDYIRAALVLEHIADVYTFMRNIHSYLEHDGKVLFIVPNEFNPLQKIVRYKVGKDWFVQKPHINYFTKHSMAEVLRKNNFEVITQTGTFPMEAWYLMGKRYIATPDAATIGQYCHTKRLQMETVNPRFMFWFYNLGYKLLGWGRETIIVARKR